jgi:hypothetical protein
MLFSYPANEDKQVEFTIRAPILGGFVLVLLLIIIMQESLSYTNARNGNRGGVAFMDAEAPLQSQLLGNAKSSPQFSPGY